MKDFCSVFAVFSDSTIGSQQSGVAILACVPRVMKRARQILLQLWSEEQDSNLAVHFSSRSDEWTTPASLFAALDLEFHFTLDPCATRENATCKRYFTRAENGLLQDWRGHVVFMNPPYGRSVGAWMRKAFESACQGATVVCLVAARTDTKWWHLYAARGEIRFLEGRVRFGGRKCAAPFPSAIVIFRPPTGSLTSSEGPQSPQANLL